MFSFVFVIYIFFFEYAGCSTDSSKLWKPPPVHRVFLDPFSINFSVCIRLVICAQKTELLPPGFSSHHHQYASASLVARSNCRQSKPRMASCSTKDEAKVLFCFAAHGELSNTLLQCSLILPIPMLNVCIPLCKGQGCLNRYLYLMILKFNKTLFTK